MEGDAAVRCGVSHPVEVAVERLEGELSGGLVGGRRGHMVIECIRHEQGARRHHGGGDALDVDGRGRAAEDVPPLSC